MKELKIKKCLKCGNVVAYLDDNGGNLVCCNEPMIEIKANTVDASYEKHIPNYEINGDKVKVYINHVMEEGHYIEWIMIKTDSKTTIFYFKPGDEPVCEVPYSSNMLIYSYCNLHGLWSKNIQED